MEVKFVMELRVDYVDRNKNEAMRIAMRQAAQHVFAVANLLADGQKPQIAIHGDDFYENAQEIQMFEDTIASGLEAIGPATERDQPSAEMLAAMQELKK